LDEIDHAVCQEHCEKKREEGVSLTDVANTISY
jgi:hypothetical protein